MKTLQEMEKEIMNDINKKERLEQYVDQICEHRHMSDTVFRQQALYREYIKYLYDSPSKIER